MALEMVKEVSTTLGLESSAQEEIQHQLLIAPVAGDCLEELYLRFLLIYNYNDSAAINPATSTSSVKDLREFCRHFPADNLVSILGPEMKQRASDINRRYSHPEKHQGLSLFKLYQFGAMSRVERMYLVEKQAFLCEFIEGENGVLSQVAENAKLFNQENGAPFACYNALDNMELFGNALRLQQLRNATMEVRQTDGGPMVGRGDPDGVPGTVLFLSNGKFMERDFVACIIMPAVEKCLKEAAQGVQKDTDNLHTIVATIENINGNGRNHLLDGERHPDITVSLLHNDG